MNCTGLSPSSYATESECSLKFFIDQRLKIRYPSKWKATDLGTLTHHVLEVLALISKAKREGKPTIFDKDVFQEWTIPEDLDIDHICEESYNYHIKLFPQHEWVKGDLSAVKKMVRSVLEDNNGHYNPLISNIIDSERYFEIPFEEEWARLEDDKYFLVRGIMDVVRRIDGGVECIDYKSGKRKDFATGKLKEYEDFEDDIQLLVYHMALRHMFPNEEMYVVTIYYLKDGGPFTIYFDDDSVDKIKKLIQKKFQKIKSTTIPRQTRTWKCSKFCDYAQKSFPKPLMEFRDGKFKAQGESMSICDQTEYAIKKHGLEWVEKNYRKPDNVNIS